MACTSVRPEQLNLAVQWDFTGAVIIENSGSFNLEDPSGDLVTIETAEQTAARTGTIPIVAGAFNFIVSNPSAAQSIAQQMTFDNNLIVTGDLTVNGTTTTINTATLEIEDPIILLNLGGADQDSGIEVTDTAANPQMIWDDSEQRWAAGRAGSLSNILLTSEIGTAVQAFGDVLDDFNTLGAATADGEFIVATAAGVFAYESGGTARSSMGTHLHDERVITSTPYTVLAADYNRVLVCESGAVQIDLPAVASSTDFVLTVKRNGSAGNITIDGNASETIDGATTLVLGTDHDSATLYCDGAEWHVVSVLDGATTPTTLAGQTDVTITSAAEGEILRRGATDWNDSGFTIPNTFAINTIVYASAADVLAALATANDGVLVTNGSGVPSISSQLPNGVLLPNDFQIQDTSADHQYLIGVSELAADRTITLPLLTGNDTFVFEAFAATLTNKSIDLANNTLTGTFAEFNTAVSDATLVSLTGAETLSNKSVNDLRLLDEAEITIDTNGDLACTQVYSRVGSFTGGAGDTLDAMSYDGGAPAIGQIAILTARTASEPITISHLGGSNANFHEFYVEGTLADIVLTETANDHVICVYAADSRWHIINAKGPQMAPLVDEFVGASQGSDTLSQTPISDAHVQVFYNGILKLNGAGDCWTRSGTTMTWIQAPIAGIDVVVQYWYQST